MALLTGAAAAVAELDPDDYRDLHLVGTVPMSLGIAKIAIANPAGLTAALKDPSIPPDSHLIMILAGHQAANPSTLKLSDVLTPLGVDLIEKSYDVQPVHHLNDTIGRLFLFKGPVMNAKPTNFEVWEAAIVAASAATRKPVAPVLVCIDSFKGGTMIPVAWQKAYVDAIKALGGTVEVRDYPHDDHFSLPQSCVADARDWLTARLP